MPISQATSSSDATLTHAPARESSVRAGVQLIRRRSATPMLAATSSVRVETTTFDPSQPDLEARIRVLGAVTEDGAIDVGTTGIDVNQLFPAHLTVSMAEGSSFTMDPGAIWFSSDGSTVDVNGPERSAQFVNNGEVEAFGGTVRMNVPVTGQGTFDVLFNNNNVRAGTLEFADDVGCATPLFTLTQPVYAEAMAMGLGDQDTAAVFEVLKKTIVMPPKSAARDLE